MLEACIYCKVACVAFKSFCKCMVGNFHQSQQVRVCKDEALV